MSPSISERENPAQNCNISIVGAWLKDAREKKGISLDDVSKVTRIGKNYLESIEAGAASKLPNQAYTRGFIRLYASHLGLSPDEALSMLEEYPLAQPENAPPQISAQKYSVKPFSAPSLKLSLIAAIAVLVAVSGYFMLNHTQRSTPPKEKRVVEHTQSSPALKTAEDKAEERPLKEATSAPSPISPEKGQDYPGTNSGIVLRLKAVSNGKVHITIDAAVSQEYDLVAGDIVEWKADNTFGLDLENAASVQGELDGVKLDPFGAPGKPAHLKLKADGIHKE